MRIRDSEFVEKLRRTLSSSTPEGAPSDLDQAILLAVLDVSNFLPVAEMVAKAVTISGQPIDTTGGGGGTDETGTGELFTSDPTDTVNQTQDVTQAAGGAGVFSAAGFKVAARLVVPTRLELVYFRLRPSVDCQIGIAFENFTAAFAGKNLIDASASARSGVVDSAGTGGTKLSALTGAADANARWWIPFHAANTIFEWPLTAPSFRLTPGAIPDGLRVRCVADVANTAIRVQWAVVWRQVPTP